MTASEVQHKTLPPDRFVWAVLDAPGLSRPGILPPGCFFVRAGWTCHLIVGE